MRPALVGALAILAVVVLMAPWAPPAHRDLPTGASATAASPRSGNLDSSGSGASPPPRGWFHPGEMVNRTYAAGTSDSSPLAGGVPTSAVIETPPPPIPPTTPTILHFLNASLGCCVEENFTVPTGTWATVILNYTGRVSGSVYDSSYRAYLDGTLVLYGTTPEYGTWTVRQNLSEYMSLLSGTANLTFLLGAALSAGYFINNVTMEFYPVPTGGTPPAAPDLIVPLWLFKSVTASTQRVYTNATVPSNVTYAVLQLYAFPYGINGGAGDEFWWGDTSGSSTPSGLRVVEFGLNSTPLGAMMPFPFVQTGAIDIFLWRPITGAFTLNMPAYRLNVTGALGTLEGTHQLWADVQGVGLNSKWVIEASLLLWTNSSVLSASPVSSSFQGPTVTTVGNTETASLAFNDRSHFVSTSGSWNSSSSAALSFSDRLVTSTPAMWQNYTILTSVSETTSTSAATGNLTELRSYDFPFSVHWGQRFVQSSTTGGGYPIYGNETDYLSNWNQAWTAGTTESRGSPVGPFIVARELVNDQLADADGVFIAPSKIASSSSPIVFLSYSFTHAATSKLYTQAFGPPAAAQSYSRFLSASAVQPAPPDFYQQVTADVTQSTPFPLSVTLAASPNSVDLGSTTAILAQPLGGVGPYGFVWSGLPAGCAGVNLSQVVCAPGVVGNFQVGVQVRDALGDLSPPSSTGLLVAPVLNATVRTTTPQVDQGGNATFTVTVTGGVPPVTCQWSFDGVVDPGISTCTGTLSHVAAAQGTMKATVRATDATGSIVASPAANVTVNAPLSVGLFVVPGGSDTTGAALNLSAQSTGGVAPLEFVWVVNGIPILGSGGANFTYVPSTAGTYSFTVSVTDAVGAQAVSNAVNATVVPARSVGNTAASSSTGNDWAWVAYVAIAAALVELAALLVLLSRRTPSRPRGPPRGPRLPRPPTVE